MNVKKAVSGGGPVQRERKWLKWSNTVPRNTRLSIDTQNTRACILIILYWVTLTHELHVHATRNMQLVWDAGPFG